MTEPTTPMQREAEASIALDGETQSVGTVTVTDFDPDNVFAQAKTRRHNLVEENKLIDARIAGMKIDRADNLATIAKLDRLIRAETPRKSPTKKAP